MDYKYVHMTKSKLLKGVSQREDKILDAIDDLKNFLDSTEDGELASMGDELSEQAVDFLQSSDLINFNDIRDFIETEYEH